MLIFKICHWVLQIDASESFFFPCSRTCMKTEKFLMPCPEWYMSHQRWPTSFGLTNTLYINFVLTKWVHFSNILSPRFMLVTLLKIYREVKPGSCLQSFEESRDTGHNLHDPCFNLLTRPYCPSAERIWGCERSYGTPPNHATREKGRTL